MASAVRVRFSLLAPIFSKIPHRKSLPPAITSEFTFQKSFDKHIFSISTNTGTLRVVKSIAFQYRIIVDSIFLKSRVGVMKALTTETAKEIIKQELLEMKEVASKIRLEYPTKSEDEKTY